MVNLNLTLRAYKGHLTRSAKELEKIATFVEINPSPRGLSELETSFKKYTTSLEKVESTIEEIIISEELEEQRINEYNTEIQGYYSKLDELRQKLLTINKNITLATKPAQPFPTTATPVKPRICDALKPFQLNDKHTPADLRNWIGKFNVYHSSSSMERYSTVEQHMFLFSCLNFSLETKVRENDSYNPELHIFGDYGVVQILQEEFDLCFPLFNRRLDFFRYRQTPGQKFTDFMIHLKQKGEEADLHSLDIDSLYVFRYITGITDSNLRERFLKLTNPNLDQLKKETRAYEIGKHAAKAMDDLDVTTVSKICDRKGTRYTKPFGFHSNKVPFQSKFPIEMKGRCWTCGSKQHDTTNCPKDKNSLTCFHCNKKGHLSTICISKFKSKSSSGDVAVVKAHSRTHSPETDEETDDDEQVNTIYCRGTKTIPNSATPRIYLEFQTSDNKHTFGFSATPDTGATRSIVAQNILSTNKIPFERTSKCRLFAANGNEMSCSGQIKLKVHNHNINAIVSPDLNNEILISWHDLQALSIIPENFPSIAELKIASTSEITVNDVTTNLKKEYPDVLNNTLEPDTVMNGPPMTIHLRKDVKIQPQRNLVARKIPLHFQTSAEKCIEKLLDLGIIKRVDTPTDWVSSGHFVPKPNGSVRLVTDYTNLNEFVQRPIHPFPTGLEIIQRLKNSSKWFAKLDAIFGYFQIPLEEESSLLTTFLIPQGRFRYTRAPMGLNASGDEWCYRSDLALENLSGKSVLYQWLPEHEIEFQKVKKLLTSDMLVKPFDYTLSTELLTDASRLHGLGFCLIQRDSENNIRLISCGSCSLTPAQSRYATIELECLAVQWAISKCNFWLRGMPHFTVITDHRPLVGIFKKALYTVENPILQRIRGKLAGYHFDTVWTPGKDHHIADALSRAPVWPSEDDDADHIKIASVCDALCIATSATANDLELDFFSKSARSCEEYKQLISALKEGKLPQNLPHNHLAKSYSKIWNDLSLYEDDKHTLVLLSGHRIVVPRDIRSEILRMLHLPHQGLVKTKQLARQCYYWPGINASITNLIDGCLTCLEFQPSQSHEPLLESTIPYVPMTHVGVDLFDALGKSYVVMVDRFSGFLFVSKITNSSTSTVTKILLKWFCDFGYPDVIRSDGGPCFRSEFSEICNQYFIKHELSSAYNPSSNGLAEAAVKNAKILLQKCKETGENFEQALSEFRLMPRADGFSPANLMFNRSPRGLLPSMRNSAAVDHIAGRKARQKTLDASHSYQSSRPTLPCLKVGDAMSPLTGLFKNNKPVQNITIVRLTSVIVV
ncbi:Transposon Ty3-I Gag-Pol polyprotein [Nymphon striatum]|nr:Transposon Ty3-I Gag-Pol polyprotein [Nymphon striatum]